MSRTWGADDIELVNVYSSNSHVDEGDMVNLSSLAKYPLHRDSWEDGYLANVASVIGGIWLRYWLQGAAAFSNIGMVEAEMSSDSYQLLGMAERGMLPEVFGIRSRYGTPILGILFSASGVLLPSWMSFQEIVVAENCMYCFGVILEFIAFIRLRMKYPNVSRPYSIPLGTVGCSLMLLPPTVLMVVILAFSTLKIVLASLGAFVIGVVLYPDLKYIEKKKWLRFSVSSDLPEFGNVLNAEYRIVQ